MIKYSSLLGLVRRKRKGGQKSLKLKKERKRRAFCLIFAKIEGQFFTLDSYISIYRKGMIETI